MPKITISEVDKTAEVAIDVTESIFYVPGMATHDIDTKPVLYGSVSDFTNNFGIKPYSFVDTQVVDGINVIASSELEKSYIYALEVLNSGAKVYFQNIIDIRDSIIYTEATGDVDKNKKYFTIAQVNTETEEVTKDNFKDYLIKQSSSNNYKYPTSYEETTYYKATIATAPKEITGLFEYKDSGVLQAYYDKLKGSSGTPSIYQNILDKWTYNVKYLTTGGYPTVLKTKKTEASTGNTKETPIDFYSIFKTMAMASAVRADSLALIDPPYEENILTSYENINEFMEKEDLSEIGNYYLNTGSINKCNLQFTVNANRKGESTLKYAQVLGPSGKYNITEGTLLNNIDEEKSIISMPGSFGYILSLLNSIQVYGNPDYLAVAGVIRGKVPRLVQLDNETTGAEAEKVQEKTAGSINLNPIVKVQNYGYCI